MNRLSNAGRPSTREPIPKGVTLVILDFDGTMTDDYVYVDQEGREMVRCHRADGWGVRMLQDNGVQVVCLSAEENPVVQQRCRKLGISVVSSAVNKLEALKELLSKRNVSAEDCLFLGNGPNDVSVLQAVGWPVVVQNAHPEAKNAARIVLDTNGGDGAVLELAERML